MTYLNLACDTGRGLIVVTKGSAFDIVVAPYDASARSSESARKKSVLDDMGFMLQISPLANKNISVSQKLSPTVILLREQELDAP